MLYFSYFIKIKIYNIHPAAVVYSGRSNAVKTNFCSNPFAGTCRKRHSGVLEFLSVGTVVEAADSTGAHFGTKPYVALHVGKETGGVDARWLYRGREAHVFGATLLCVGAVDELQLKAVAFFQKSKAGVVLAHYHQS